MKDVRKKAILTIIAICSLWLLLNNQAYAEDAAVLLNKYGVAVDNAAEEGKKLVLIENAYYQVAKTVNTNAMLNAAAEVYDVYAKEQLSALDLQIYQLSDELAQVQQRMEQAKSREVSFILELDAEYRTTADSLAAKMRERNKLADQYTPAVRPSEPEQDKKQLRNLSAQVNAQRSKYEKALVQPELGEITHFRSPLVIEAQMTSGFGIRLDPVTRTEMSFHKGMDLRAPEGTTVLAAFNGKVEEASSNTEIGNYIVLDHGQGIKTLYGHLSSIQVTPGQVLQQYEPIAKSGNTGTQSTGAHLHFGVFINGQAVDPALFVPHT
ncbi:M23 family metallopeptidase [Paenibacillus athensensis]|uniref:M23 family metallopeptidase n=1 Tax=Paenibacillus athensensis TaxID=1967502 RepID=UPI001E43BC91|nr:M23 family metallopeptidase [Paenibacillus athensensis]